MFYGVKLLQKGGLDQGMSLIVSLVMYSLCQISTLFSMVAMRRFGRRSMWLGGLIVEILCLLAIGIAGCFLDKAKPSLCWAIAGFLCLYAVLYNFTTGPVCYTIVAETPSTRLKASTNSLSRVAYIAVGIINLFLAPKLLDDRPDGWGLGPRAAFVWAGTGSLCLLWAWFRLPETKDKTPAEIDVMFANM